jgi:hypothetical protein
MCSPFDVSVANDGTVFVAEYDNSRVLQYCTSLAQCPPTVSASAQQTYCVAGGSNGSSWDWKIELPTGVLAAGPITIAGLPSGQAGPQFASAFVSSINANSTFTAAQLASPHNHCFSLTKASASAFDLFVRTPSGTGAWCSVTNGATTGCSFNPTATLTGILGDQDADGYTDIEEMWKAGDPVVFCAIMRADVDINAVVNAADLGRVASKFGPQPPALRENQDGNTAVNAADLGRVAMQFGKNISLCT